MLCSWAKVSSPYREGSVSKWCIKSFLDAGTVCNYCEFAAEFTLPICSDGAKRLREFGVFEVRVLVERTTSKGLCLCSVMGVGGRADAPLRR